LNFFRLNNLKKSLIFQIGQEFNQEKRLK